MDTAGPAVPGMGWPGDPATAATPVADEAHEVAKLAASAGDLAELTARQSVCRACPRLVSWREDVARVRRRSFITEPYWGRPVPGWGDPEPAILILGLAPAAHGGNRTGRIFTGDRSGDFLFASLHRVGLAGKPTSVTADDGQRLTGARMAAAVRCAPPGNKPTPEERDTCAPWLVHEFRMVTATLRAVVCLGGFAWQSLWPVLAGDGYTVPRPRPAFGHGAEVTVSGPGGPPLLVLGCYHPSQQNTFTGRITPEMSDAIFRRAQTWAAEQRLWRHGLATQITATSIGGAERAGLVRRLVLMVMARLGGNTGTSGPRDQADRAATFGLVAHWPAHQGWAAGVICRHRRPMH